MKQRQWKENVAGYLFILPSLIGFCIFMVYPFINSFLISFMDWDNFGGFAGSEFIGLENYKETLTNDYFKTGLTNNLGMLFIAVPILLMISLIIANVMNTKIFARGALRTAYFLPYITTVTASSMVFAALFHEEYGPINSLIRMFGVDNPPGWLNATKTVMITIGIFWIWRMMGYCIIIFLSGLQGISPSYYEAASIDGANTWQKFKSITFPLVSPTTFFLAITMGIFSLQMMAEVKVMTSGGPGSASYTMALLIYREAFEKYNMGFASAIAVIFFGIILVITLIQWYGQKKWVNY
ncbi:MAG: sugar ABC transporter permease [Eubacteriales bacterium]